MTEEQLAHESGKRLKLVRDEANLSQTELAVEANVGRSSLSRNEQGHSRVSRRNARRIAAVLAEHGVVCSPARLRAVDLEGTNGTGGHDLGS